MLIPLQIKYASPCLYPPKYINELTFHWKNSSCYWSKIWLAVNLNNSSTPNDEGKKQYDEFSLHQTFLFPINKNGFSYIVVVSLIGGGNRSTPRKNTSPWTGFEFTTRTPPWKIFIFLNITHTIVNAALLKSHYLQ
jgi:hypothetical protein